MILVGVISYDYGMKIMPRDIDNFIRSPNPKARVILVYGPDSGLMKERIKALGLQVVADLNDPFNAVTLTGDQLKDDPARLSDETNAMSMMGGDRLIRIQDAGDKLTVLVKSYLENPSDSALVLLEGGDLSTRSSLRKACEADDNAAAIPCYVEDERDLSRFIKNEIAAVNLRIDHDAVTWLASSIQGDRARARSEVEKLIVYKHGDENTQISLDDVLASCGAGGATSMDDLIHAIGLGQADKALGYWGKLNEEGIAFIATLRALQNHFKRLHQARAMMDNGSQADQAMKALSPPVFFKYKNQFQAQLQKWRFTSIQKVLERLMNLEADCKKPARPLIVYVRKLS